MQAIPNQVAESFIVWVRPYLEGAYFVANIALACGLIAAFFQVKLLKRDIRIRNERAAKEKAIEAAHRYLNNFVEKDRIRGHNYREAKLTSYSGSIGDFSIDSIKSKSQAVKRGLAEGTLEVLNELEGISAYFVSGVADESTGFQIFGKSFCHSTEAVYDVLCFVRGNDHHPYFQNIVRLYKLWRPRLAHSELESTRSRLERQISDLGKSQPIKPVGTE